VQGAFSYEENKSQDQENVKLWLEKKDISALIIRCPNCGLLHIMMIFLFDTFFENVFKKDEVKEE